MMAGSMLVHQNRDFDAQLTDTLIGDRNYPIIMF
jgi:hypothetical protein